MSTDVNPASAFCPENGFNKGISRSTGINDRFFLRRNKTSRVSRISPSKRGLNGFVDTVVASKEGSDSSSPKENLVENRRSAIRMSKNSPLHESTGAIDPNTDLTCSKQNRTISVHETYQLGYFDTASDAGLLDRLYVFDFVDGLEVTYPISVTSDALPADLPPLFLEPEYVDQLSTLASTALNQLTTLLNNWLTACQKAHEQHLIWYHISAHEEAVSLRKQIIRLIDQLVPSGHVGDFVDFQSPLTDRFLAKLATALSTDTHEDVPHCTSHEDAIPMVSLCPDPAHCVDALRTQIYQLIQVLVPHLRLPQSFQLERDLEPLLSILHECNPRPG